MSPAVVKTLLTLGAGVAASLAFVPQLAPYQAALTALAGFLGGGAHVPRPGDLAKAEAATAALADALRKE